MKRKKTEQGQILVLLTLGVITLLGFAALAIDGGRVLGEKRNIQGVSDTTAMTGGLYLAYLENPATAGDKTAAINAAIARAADNGYNSGQVTVSITEDSKYYYVQSDILSSVQPTIGRIVYGDDFDVAARTIARVEKISVFALGHAFYAKNPTACGAIDHSGNADVTIVNSGIFSNSNCADASKCSDNSITITGSASFDGDIITAAGGVCIQKPDDVHADNIVTGAGQNTLPTLDEPDCSGLTAQTFSAGTNSPGIYSGGIHFSGGETADLEPGLYCLDDDLSINNGTLTGDNVMFYLRNGAGLNINGGDISLTAPKGDPWTDGSGVYWNGMLIFQAYGNTEELVMNGNAGSYFEGTIFVPDANCKINGSGATTALNIQVVCDTIDFIGTADMYLVYTEEDKYIPPKSIELVQ